MTRRKKKAAPRPGASGELRVIPLGGLGEIGKNMTLIEYQHGETFDSIIIDTGIMFPEGDMLGIDYIIPDYRYLMDHLETVRAVFITHGHEDHTGAIAHVMEHLNVPIYGTPLTIGLLDVKLKTARLTHALPLLTTVQAGDILNAGVFKVELFHVCHSIPDSVGLGIDTPLGLLVHSGDFKFDHTPVDAWPPDYAKLAEFSRRGVLLLMSDSTNADKAGWTPSETVIDAALDRVFQRASGRIIISTFASLVSRVQQVANASQRHNRKIAFVGFSMVENMKMARELGYLEIPEELIVDVGHTNQMPKGKVVIVTTGTQGEPSSGLGRLATGSHRALEVEEDDTVIVSAHPIPGNQEMVYRTINKLIQRGAEVIYDPIEQVHVSGHAAREELKLLINLIRPKYFLPVHGELRHLHLHAQMAVTLGVPPDNVAVVENGTIIHLTEEGMSIGERVPGGYVFVDGSVVGDVGPAVMRDREILGQNGFVIVNLTLNRDTRDIVGEPEIISRGFVYLKESGTLIDATQDAINGAINTNGRNSLRDIRAEVQRRLEKLFYVETKRRPMVFTFIHEV